MAEATADGNSIPSQPIQPRLARPTIVPSSAGDYAGPDSDTETIQIPRFAGQMGTGVKLYMMVGLPTFLVFLGLYGGYRVYQDIIKPVAIQKIAQDQAVTEHTITATDKMRSDAGAMGEMVTQQKLTNQHLETLGKSHEKMWQVMERMDRHGRANAKAAASDEQGRVETEPGPPGTGEPGGCE